MNWRQILKRAKAERVPLQKQANEIEKKLDSIDLEIFRAEQGIKIMDKRKKLEESEEVDCYNHPDNPPCCGEDE